MGRPSPRHARAAPATLAAIACAASPALGGCHVVTHNTTTVPDVSERVVHRDRATAGRPSLILTDAGQLRFIEPLECPSEELLHQRTTLERTSRPNLATFTVGVIATAVGGILLTSGLFASQPSSSPATYAGLASAGLGLPFAIGPWIGNGTERRELRDLAEPANPDAQAPVTAARRAGPSQPCGDRPFAGRAATLDANGLEIHGAIDRDGVFEVSPYQWIDAFAAAAASPVAVTARVDVDRGAPRTIAAVFDTRSLASHAAAFLAAADFDPRVEPLRLVPGLIPGALRVGLATTARGPVLRVALSVRNDGPGDSWALRGQITAPAAPSVDGRMLYLGKVARGTTVDRELVIPLTPAAAAALRGAPQLFSLELRDAHGTAPTTPVRFRGPVPSDVAR